MSAQVSESLCEQIDYIKSEFQVYEQVAKSTAYAIDIFGENVSPVELAEMVCCWSFAFFFFFPLGFLLLLSLPVF